MVSTARAWSVVPSLDGAGGAHDFGEVGGALREPWADAGGALREQWAEAGGAHDLGEVGEALREHWAELRARLDAVLRDHLAQQDELLARCLSPGAGALRCGALAARELASDAGSGDIADPGGAAKLEEPQVLEEERHGPLWPPQCECRDATPPDLGVVPCVRRPSTQSPSKCGGGGLGAVYGGRSTSRPSLMHSPSKILHSPSKFSDGGGSRVSDIMESTRGYASQNGFMRQVCKGRLGAWLDAWESLEQPTPKGCLANLVLNRRFDVVCVSIIGSNAIYSGYLTNYEMAHLQDPTPRVLQHVDQAYIAFYTLELVLKLLVHRLWFFYNRDMAWNLFDFALVLISVADLSVSLLHGGAEDGASVTFMRILRLLRLAKLLRGLRVIRYLTALRLMLNSLLGSMSRLFWSIVMMALIFYVFALIFVQGATLQLYLHAPSMPTEDVARLLKEFGSVEVAMLSLYRAVTGGDSWAMIYDVALLCGISYAVLFVFFIAFSQIAFLNILTAIFVNHAIELAQPDREALAVEHRRRELEAYEELRGLCKVLDPKCTGTITGEEFDRQLRSGRLGAHLALLGLNVVDTQNFFRLLLFAANAESQQEVSAADFVEGCMRMRGDASGIDLWRLDRQTQLILRLQEDTEERLGCIAEDMQEVLLRTGRDEMWSL